VLGNNLNRGWTFFNVNDEATKTVVNLPHDAMQTEKRIPRLKHGAASGYFPGGKYVYTKTLFGEQDFADKTVVLEFEGIYIKSRVYLNGEDIGGRIYGYSNFYVDLTDKLRIGQENEIKVIVDNTQTPNSRWYSGSGIYRDVCLFVGNKHHIELDGVRVVTKSVNPAVLSIEVKAVKTASMEIITEILQDGRPVATGKGEQCEIPIADARLWDVDHPNLCDVRVMLIENGTLIDEAWVRTGIRKLEWNATQGLLVNGQSVKLRGGCIHHDNGPLGACSFKKAELRKVEILKQAGFNAIRSAHNPAGKALLEACDELGMYVMNETFDMWKLKKTDYDYALYFDAEWEKDVASMVMASRNHPSVIMYSIGNEIPDTGLPSGAEISRKLSGLCKQLDPTRPTTNAISLMLAGMGAMGAVLNKSQTSPEDVVNPYREDPKANVAGSLLVNVLVTMAPLLTKVFSSTKRAEKVARGSFEALDIVGYNYAEHAYQKHHEWNPERVMVGSETFPHLIARNWKRVETMPFVIGDFMWTGWDYLGETGVGLPLYGQRRGPFNKPYPCVSAGCGAVDMTGFIDAQGIYAAVVWNIYKKPYIGVRPVNHTGEKVFFGMWRGTDAVNSWSWKGQEDRHAEIEVFSIGDTVELIQDGQSLGKHKLNDFKAKFKTIYQPGELVAISYDVSGKEIARSSLKTAAQETVLTVAPEEAAVQADGQDLAYISVHITDSAGITKMLDERTVTVEVDGAGTLAAVGSGNPVTEETFTGSSYTTYQGRMIAIVRSNGKKGTIKVKVSSLGLESKEITLEAR
jgi:beta-galactosidase